MKPTPDARSVIINADDFGLSAGINRGIIEAHEPDGALARRRVRAGASLRGTPRTQGKFS